MTSFCIRAAVLFMAVSTFLGGAEPVKVQVFYGSNRQGEVEPCGCSVNQLGGMGRLEAFFKRKQSELAGKPTLFVDAGDTFFSMEQLNERRKKQEGLRARLVAKAYGTLHLDAFSPGERDFAGGIDELFELQKISGAKFVASNLQRADGQPLFDSKLLIEKRGVRIGLLGLADPEAFARVSGVKVAPPLEVAPAKVKELRESGAQFVVALSHLGLTQDRELAKIPGIDLIVGSHSLDSLTTPEKVGETWIVQPLNQGQQIGQVELVLNSPDKRKHWLTDLDKRYVEKNEIEKWVEKYKSQVRDIAVEQSGTVTPVSSEKPYVAHPFQCRTCHQKQYDFWEKTQHAAAYMVLYSKNQHFDPECISCHSLGYSTEGGFADITEPILLNKSDSKAPPAKSKLPFVETMMKDVFGAEAKKGALSSIKQKARFKKLHVRYDAKIRELEEKERIAKLYIGVQCEHCHGNRHGHPDPAVATLKRVSDDTCKNCHAQPNAVEFTDKTLPAAKKRIACPLSGAKS